MSNAVGWAQWALWKSFWETARVLLPIYEIVNAPAGAVVANGAPAPRPLARPDDAGVTHGPSASTAWAQHERRAA